MCYICFLSHTYEGKASDKSLVELSGYTLPPGSYLYQDKGFQGFFLHDITIVQAKKKPPGAELTPPEKATNRRIASIRIRIEHAIGGGILSWKHVVACITFAYSTDHSTTPYNKY